MYERKWRLYFNTDIVYNSESGLGYSVVGGIGGILFGADRLAFETRYSSGVGSIQGAYYKIMVVYNLYGWN
ncbi:MAG: hypothetical protein PHQ22_08115 [Sulfuricurvum sp.]|nr:hypothetical protein [Sulfuricurvum sp.]MDD5387140.1 hypothetical protein [Sulfuricurvum sp.]